MCEALSSIISSILNLVLYKYNMSIDDKNTVHVRLNVMFSP